MSKFKVGDVLVRVEDPAGDLPIGTQVVVEEVGLGGGVRVWGYRGFYSTACFELAPCVAVREAIHEDVVNSPTHYAFFPDLEAIQVIARAMTQEQFYGYCLGNRLKYRLRAGKKDALEQDIAKSDKYTELYEQHKHLCHS